MEKEMEVFKEKLRKRKRVTVVSGLVFEKVSEDRDFYKRKCEEYCNRIIELGEELRREKNKK